MENHVTNVIRKQKSVRCQLIQLTFSNALKPVAKRIWTSDPSLRRAPTYCHSLSIWGKVNPYGTLYKTVSDSIRVILNTPLSSSVKLWKLADCLLQLIIGECLDITIDICYMTTMLRTFDHGKQYSIKTSYRKHKIFFLSTINIPHTRRFVHAFLTGKFYSLKISVTFSVTESKNF